MCTLIIIDSIYKILDIRDHCGQSEQVLAVALLARDGRVRGDLVTSAFGALGLVLRLSLSQHLQLVRGFGWVSRGSHNKRGHGPHVFRDGPLDIYQRAWSKQHVSDVVHRLLDRLVELFFDCFSLWFVSVGDLKQVSCCIARRGWIGPHTLSSLVSHALMLTSRSRGAMKNIMILAMGFLSWLSM